MQTSFPPKKNFIVNEHSFTYRRYLCIFILKIYKYRRYLYKHRRYLKKRKLISNVFFGTKKKKESGQRKIRF